MICLKQVLSILARNQVVNVYDERDKLLYHGVVADLLLLHEHTYLCSCLIVDMFTRRFEGIVIIVAYD